MLPQLYKVRALVVSDEQLPHVEPEGAHNWPSMSIEPRLCKTAMALLRTLETSCNSRESGNPRKFEPEGKLVSSVDFELRQTLPHQHDRTRYLLLRPPLPGSATTEQHDLKALTQEDPNFAMASFQHMPSHELRVLAIRASCTHCTTPVPQHQFVDKVTGRETLKVHSVCANHRGIQEKKYKDEHGNPKKREPPGKGFYNCLDMMQKLTAEQKTAVAREQLQARLNNIVEQRRLNDKEAERQHQRAMRAQARLEQVAARSQQDAQLSGGSGGGSGGGAWPGVAGQPAGPLPPLLLPKALQQQAEEKALGGHSLSHSPGGLSLMQRHQQQQHQEQQLLLQSAMQHRHHHQSEEPMNTPDAQSLAKRQQQQQRDQQQQLRLQIAMHEMQGLQLPHAVSLQAHQHQQQEQHSRHLPSRLPPPHQLPLLPSLSPPQPSQLEPSHSLQSQPLLQQPPQQSQPQLFQSLAPPLPQPLLAVQPLQLPPLHSQQPQPTEGALALSDGSGHKRTWASVAPDQPHSPHPPLRPPSSRPAQSQRGGYSPLLAGLRAHASAQQSSNGEAPLDPPSIDLQVACLQKEEKVALKALEDLHEGPHPQQGGVSQQQQPEQVQGALELLSLLRCSSASTDSAHSEGMHYSMRSRRSSREAIVNCSDKDAAADTRDANPSPIKEHRELLWKIFPKKKRSDRPQQGRDTRPRRRGASQPADRSHSRDHKQRAAAPRLAVRSVRR